MAHAYRLLGAALHTLEDFVANSMLNHTQIDGNRLIDALGNWCELGLRKLGYKDVLELRT